MKLMQLEPYVMLRSNDSSGPQFYGFIVDVLDRLSELVGFSYSLHLAPDGSFGFQQADGSWDGIIGQVIRKVKCVNNTIIYNSISIYVTYLNLLRFQRYASINLNPDM